MGLKSIGRVGGVSATPKAGTYGNVRNFVPMDNLAAWDNKAGAGVTFEIDPTVLFDGRPSIKITFPPGTTSGFLGTLGETAIMPRAWDLSGTVLAFRCSKLSATNGPNLFIGDASGFANNTLSWGQGPASYSQSTRDNEWIVYHVDKAKAGGISWTETGAYVNKVARRLRISLALTAAQAEPVSFWIGALGIKQPRPKPTLIFTYDDSRASIYSHVYPLFKACRIPMSLAVISGAIGTAGYMTAQQVLEMAQDPSGLFEMVTHSSTHTNVNLAGDERYVREVIEVRDWLRALGIKGDGPDHHAWVQSVFTNGAIDGLKAAGFLSARAAGAAYAYRAHSDQCIRAGDKTRWLLNSLTTLGNTKDAAGMIAEIDAWRSVGGFAMVNGHDFGPTSSDAYTMAISEHTQLVEYVASLRDAGLIEPMLWSEWFNTYCR
ncbi:UNVERIFIED_ORG: polysaccharide deacetylase family protein [Shinella sp. XGS7]|nr:polysaccharide deacetylase family protein [Shinella sp. XGS7]